MNNKPFQGFNHGKGAILLDAKGVSQAESGLNGTAMTNWDMLSSWRKLRTTDRILLIISVCLLSIPGLALLAMCLAFIGVMLFMVFVFVPFALIAWIPWLIVLACETAWKMIVRFSLM